MPRKIHRYSVAWKYFSDIGNSLAVCKLCSKKLSFKTSVSNLVKHVRKSHKHVNLEETRRSLLEEKKNANATASSDEDEGDRTSNDEQLIWSYFERETGGRARCVVCRGTLSQEVDSLRQHLQIEHPKLASGLVLGSDGDANSDRVENEEIVTEYVYLDDGSDINVQKTAKNDAYKRKRQSSAKQHKVRRHSSSSDEGRKVFYVKSDNKSKEQPNDDIETFGRYILSVMKTLPRQVQAKLQLDIVNSVMSAKLEYETDQLKNSINECAEPVAGNERKPHLYVKSNSQLVGSNEFQVKSNNQLVESNDNENVETVASTFTSNGYAISVANRELELKNT